MRLYHGTNIMFDEIDLHKSKPNKDFGQGFYLSPDFEQALKMAKIKTEQQQEGTPLLIHDYDIVIGPIANDRVGVQLWKYENQLIDLPTLVCKLKYMKGLTLQYFFGTEKALSILKRIK